VKRLGLDNEGISEIIVVVDVFNGTTKVADAYPIETDVSPDPE